MQASKQCLPAPLLAKWLTCQALLHAKRLLPTINACAGSYTQIHFSLT